MAFYGRGPNKIQNPYTLREMYKDYISKVEEGTPYYVSYATYVRITTAYFKKVAEVILEESDKFKLISGLGIFQIIKKRIKAINQTKRFHCIDWYNSVKYGKKVVHLNEHSGGFKYLFYWNRKGTTTKNALKYRFIPTRTIKRTLAKYIKDKVKDYFEYDL